MSPTIPCLERYNKSKFIQLYHQVSAWAHAYYFEGEYYNPEQWEIMWTDAFAYMQENHPFPHYRVINLETSLSMGDFPTLELARAHKGKRKGHIWYQRKDPLGWIWELQK